MSAKAWEYLSVDGRHHLAVEEKYRESHLYWYMEPYTALSIFRCRYLSVARLDAAYR